MDASSSDYGMVAQAAVSLFQKAKQSLDNITFRLSILEIYNETLVDLLVDLPSQNGIINTKAKLNILETDNGVLVPGLHIMPIDSLDDTLTLLMEAQANRAVAEHQLNHVSSRSHIIYSYYITRTSSSSSSSSATASSAAISSASAATLGNKKNNKNNSNRDSLSAKESQDGGDNNSIIDDPIVHQSKLHIVDLAGSERTNKTGSVGNVQKEANYINRSLSYLEQVVIALSQSNRDHIPYRQSKLTYLLKDSLGGNSNTYMIACIWPRKDHAWETLSTLRFAARMKSIETHPIRNRLVSKESSANGNGQIKSLQAQIELLKKELAMRDFIHGYDSWLTDLNKQQIASSSKQFYDFLLQPPVSTNNDVGENYNTSIAVSSGILPYNTISPIEIHSLSQINYLFHFMKDVIYELAEPNKQENQSDENTGKSKQDVIQDNLEKVIQQRYLKNGRDGPAPEVQQKLGKKLISLLPKNKKRINSIQENSDRMINRNKSRDEEQQLMERNSNLSLPVLKKSLSNEVLRKEEGIQEDFNKPNQSETPQVGEDLQLNNEYFQDFVQRTSAGKDLHQAYEELKETLKNNKKRQKQIITLLNDQKYLLDEVNIEVNQYQQIIQEKLDLEKEQGIEHQSDDEDMKEINRIVAEKKEKAEKIKKEYRTIHQELLICKDQIQESQNLKKRAMNALLMAFNDYMKSLPEKN